MIVYVYAGQSHYGKYKDPQTYKINIFVDEHMRCESTTINTVLAALRMSWFTRFPSYHVQQGKILFASLMKKR